MDVIVIWISQLTNALILTINLALILIFNNFALSSHWTCSIFGPHASKLLGLMRQQLLKEDLLIWLTERSYPSSGNSQAGRNSLATGTDDGANFQETFTIISTWLVPICTGNMLFHFPFVLPLAMSINEACLKFWLISLASGKQDAAITMCKLNPLLESKKYIVHVHINLLRKYCLAVARIRFLWV